MPIPERVEEFLSQGHARYEVIHHHTDHTAAQTAWDTHTPTHSFAKTVFVVVDGRPAMVVLPADDDVQQDRLREALGASELRLAAEAELARWCPDCEPGAAPPFGPLYELPVYLSPELERVDTLTFNGGTHQDAIRMPYVEFARLVEPTVLAVGYRD